MNEGYHITHPEDYDYLHKYDKYYIRWGLETNPIVVEMIGSNMDDKTEEMIDSLLKYIQSTNNPLKKYAVAFVKIISNIKNCRPIYDVSCSTSGYVFRWKSEVTGEITHTFEIPSDNAAIDAIHIVAIDYIKTTTQIMIIEDGLEIANLTDYVIRNLKL